MYCAEHTNHGRIASALNLVDSQPCCANIFRFKYFKSGACRVCFNYVFICAGYLYYYCVLFLLQTNDTTQRTFPRYTRHPYPRIDEPLQVIHSIIIGINFLIILLSNEFRSPATLRRPGRCVCTASTGICRSFTQLTRHGFCIIVNLLLLYVQRSDNNNIVTIEKRIQIVRMYDM